MTPARRQEIAAEIRAELVARFPACFMPKGAEKRPLAIGIFRAIRERWPEVSALRLGVAMCDYTRGQKYLRQMVEGAARTDLDGNPAGTVTAEEAKFAAERLAALERYFRERRAAKRGKRGPAVTAAIGQLRALDRRRRPDEQTTA